jgi:MFS-type transporter involved in bile tolerance (Atg22 family)
MHNHKSLAAELSLKAVLHNHGGSGLISMSLTWTLTATVVVVILKMPMLLQKRFHLDAATTLAANVVATWCMAFGCIVAGALAGRFGSTRTIFFGRPSRLHQINAIG